MKIVVLLAASSALAAAATSDQAVTFHRDVEPVLQARCQECHRAGQIAPMSLVRYDETRPWAQAIKESVRLRRMPPWHAEPGVGAHFANDRSLSDAEIEMLTRWADGGAVRGDLADAPPRIARFVDGWNIGQPDKVVEMPVEFEVPAEGDVDYNYLVIPSGFTQDTWVQAVEIRPGNREVVHHVIVFVRPPDSSYMIEAQPGAFYVPDKRSTKKRGPRRNERRDFFAGYAPGSTPELLEPGQARKISAGSDFVLQLHYTPSGKPQRDRSSFGLVLAKAEPREEIRTLAVSDNTFTIPPGDPAFKVDAVLEVKKPMTLRSLTPHMHLRGKAFEYRLVALDGSKRVLLNVPGYDFNWQSAYELAEPITLDKGMKLEGTAVYDNSPNNPANPDPGAAVRYGDQSWEEMMFGFFTASFPVEKNASDD